MLIRMLSTAPGSVDGIRVASYAAGQEYDLTATAGARDLAAAFVGSGLAEEVGVDPTPPTDPALAGADESAADTDAAGDTPAPTATKSGRKPKA